MKKPQYRLQQGLTWRLSDPGMGLLERAGLAALYMSLRAAQVLGQQDKLAPLNWNSSELTSDSVGIWSSEDDRTALSKLLMWAWQVRDGVLYLPAVHREVADRDFYHRRLSAHNGILCTFLQHPNTQPRMDWESRLVQPNETEEYKVSFQVPAERIDDDDRPVNPNTGRPHKKKVPTTRLRLLDDVGRLVNSKGVLTEKNVSLSNWVYPGISGRYGSERSWEGSAMLSILVMLAPIVCLYSQLHNQRDTWTIIIPDVRDLEEFDICRASTALSGSLKLTDVASLGDAGLRFLAAYETRRLRVELATGCRVVAMGKVGYYRSQNIRKGVVDVPADARLLKRYRMLEQHLGNRWMRRKVDKEQIRDSRREQRESEADQHRAAGFVVVPTVRGRISDNLIAGLPWYADLFTPLPWDFDALERQRKRQAGTSILRLWFNNLCYQRRSLVELIQEDELWDDPSERKFVEAFWEILGALYYREKEAVERGGSRKWGERIEDLNEEIRRNISRAKTGPLLRETLAELFARPVQSYRSPQVRRHPGLMWNLMNKDWKRGRDLALLALASYQRKDKRSSAAADQLELRPKED